jgi:1,4-dihydroxy-2-naphthoate octaprenyltransferase
MAAAIGAALVGSLYAPAINIPHLLVFCAGVAFALYYAHVKDSYVDFYIRHEDDSFDLSKKQAKEVMLLCAVVVAACALYFAWAGLWLAIPIIAAGFLLAYFHTPLDLNPIGATAGYPTGLALAAIGGYYVQAGVVPLFIIEFAFAVWLVLCGVKIVDDVKDYKWDKGFGKITMPVLLGQRECKYWAALIVFIGASVGIALTLQGVLPFFSALSFLPLYPAALLSLTRHDKKSIYGLDVMLAGTFAFLVVQLTGLMLKLN